MSLLLETDDRLTIFPIKYNDIYELYQKAERSFWRAEEIDLSSDKKDWDNKLTEHERKFISNILIFFSMSDVIVGMNLLDNILNSVNILEAKFLYTYQAMIENIHTKMYGFLVLEFIPNEQERNKLTDLVKTSLCIKKKLEWALKWTNNKDISFVEKLVAFVIVEGLFFSGSFAAIFWLKEKNILKGLCKSNEFISRDEELHTTTGILHYTKYVKNENKLSQSKIYEIIKEAIEVEKEFFNESLKIDFIQMNKSLMNQYIEYVADLLLERLGYEKLFNVTNPFLFMQKIEIDNKTNFFEERVSEYTPMIKKPINIDE